MSSSSPLSTYALCVSLKKLKLVKSYTYDPNGSGFSSSNFSKILIRATEEEQVSYFATLTKLTLTTKRV